MPDCHSLHGHGGYGAERIVLYKTGEIAFETLFTQRNPPKSIIPRRSFPIRALRRP